MKNTKKSQKSNIKQKLNLKCQNCRIIRFFLLSVLLIVLLGFIKNDKLHYLQIVTPQNAATVIISLGLIMFLIKLAKYFLERNQD